MDLKRLTLEVKGICEEADKNVIRPYLVQKEISIKRKDDTGRNLVTQVDIETEQFLKNKLHDLIPEAGIIAEESSNQSDLSTLNWIIDPIDGTTNFIHGLPPYCISIALYENHKPLIGVVYELFSKECFYAWENGNAWCNGNRIGVSDNVELNNALLCTGFPYDQSNSKRFSAWLDLHSSLLRTTRGVRRLGAAAVDLAYVAAGRLDGYYEYDLKPWDVAAGICLIKEAGGVLSDFEGGRTFLDGSSIVATSHKTLLDNLLLKIRQAGV